MRRWKSCAVLTLAFALGALGCGGGSAASTAITLQISPIAASVILNTSQQFSSIVTGSTDSVVTWGLNDWHSKQGGFDRGT